MNNRFETFTTLINKISRNIKKLKNQEMEMYNLRNSHISCLYYIYLLNGATSTQLCEHAQEDKATISRALEYLEKNDFITCENQNVKRYNSMLLLTDKGEKIAKKIANKINYFLERLSTALTEDETITFYKNLSTISDRLDNFLKNNEIKEELWIF